MKSTLSLPHQIHTKPSIVWFILYSSLLLMLTFDILIHGFFFLLLLLLLFWHCFKRDLSGVFLYIFYSCVKKTEKEQNLSLWNLNVVVSIFTYFINVERCFSQWFIYRKNLLQLIDLLLLSPFMLHVWQTIFSKSTIPTTHLHYWPFI